MNDGDHPQKFSVYYYQMNTFHGMKWGTWSDEVKTKWDAAVELGDRGRKTIKGHDRLLRRRSA